MKILFSPSEAKTSDASDETYIPSNQFGNNKQVLELYKSYLLNSSQDTLGKLFGLKKECDIEFFKSIDIFNSPTIKAVLRYSGVAYEHLEYKNLEQDEQKFIDKNLIIFSNLFGPITANNLIPNYKLKQGKKLGDFLVEKYYKQESSPYLDEFLKDEFIIDLRAGFYLKFYTLKTSHVTLKFIKEGKVISHWAKAYRGKILKELSHHQPQNEKEFQKISFKNLQIREIIKRKNINEYIFDIID